MAKQKKLKHRTILRRFARLRQDQYEEADRHEARERELDAAREVLDDRCPHARTDPIGITAGKRCHACGICFYPEEED